jgi:G3E family GTPase
MSCRESGVPVMVLTGFLGSGKTTFLRYLLSKQSEKKIAVIQNEFGESIGIEEVG